MKVFDCFIFFNELDLLELRLNVLDDCVDCFVIAESAITFQGEEKEFIFEKNRSRFAKFDHKIVYFKVTDCALDFENLPYIADPQCLDGQILNSIYRFIDDCPHFNKATEFWWGNDFYQRECIWRALATAKPEPGDLIMISDVDEIPKPETIMSLKDDILPESLFCLRQHEFCYYFNYYHNSDWVGTCCFLFSSFANVSLNSIRFATKRDEGHSPQIIDDGGWHFTSMGSIASIKRKIMSWGHREYNTKTTLNSVEYNVQHGYDIFRRPGFGRLKYLPASESIMPQYLRHHISDLLHLIGPEIKNENLFQKFFYSSYFYTLSKFSSILIRVNRIIGESNK